MNFFQETCKDFSGVSMPICKMCGEKREKLIRCHIYPVSMSKEISGTPHCLVAMSTRDERLISHYAHGGIYDDGIVCEYCEKLFKEPDDYAIDFRRRVLNLSIPATLRLNTTKLPSFEVSAEKLHRFAMQTWLRSHLSQRHENLQVNDHVTGNLISRLILDRKETIGENIEVAFLFFTSDLAQVMMSPVHYQDSEFPFYSMWMPNMNIFISSGQKGLPPAFSMIRLERQKPVTVLRTKKVFDSMFETILDGVIPHYEKISLLFDNYSKKK